MDDATESCTGDTDHLTDEEKMKRIQPEFLKNDLVSWLINMFYTGWVVFYSYFCGINSDWNCSFNYRGLCMLN